MDRISRYRYHLALSRLAAAEDSLSSLFHLIARDGRLTGGEEFLAAGTYLYRRGAIRHGSQCQPDPRLPTL